MVVGAGAASVVSGAVVTTVVTVVGTTVTVGRVGAGSTGSSEAVVVSGVVGGRLGRGGRRGQGHRRALARSGPRRRHDRASCACLTGPRAAPRGEADGEEREEQCGEAGRPKASRLVEP